MSQVRAAIVGIAGPELRAEEAELFRDLPPAGVILFARNCQDRAQLRALTGALRACQPARRLPILIDQEGGRVMRLKPPHWRALPACGRLAAAGAAADEAAWLQGRLIAHDLSEVGIDVACAPVIDVARVCTTPAIGDRSFGTEPAEVARLARHFALGLVVGGVAPVLKHLPGHGRARVDSHAALPIVTASFAELWDDDLVPARLLAHLPLAMTAHVLYPALDPEHPATLSRPIIEGVIRRAVGFAGLLLSDDLAMHALSGTPASRAEAAVAAGCDLALACTGDLAESAAVLEAVPDFTPAKLTQLHAALPPPAAEPFQADLAEGRLRALLEPLIA